MQAAVKSCHGLDAGATPLAHAATLPAVTRARTRPPLTRTRTCTHLDINAVVDVALDHRLDGAEESGGRLGTQQLEQSPAEVDDRVRDRVGPVAADRAERRFEDRAAEAEGVPPDQLADTRVEMTFFEGRRVYERGE